MFDVTQFTALYQLLDEEMVEGDCGVRCEQYCCRAAAAVKYLLPGEADYFLTDSPPNFQLIDQTLFTGYRARNADQCACTRALRPFCCRIFPFRPVIDLTAQRVIDLTKARGAGFDLHCWVSEPRAEWRVNAIAAWQAVLDDRDNLNFYARYAIYLKLACEQPFIAASSLLYQVEELLTAMTIAARWRAASAFFQMLGRAPAEWEDF